VNEKPGTSGPWLDVDKSKRSGIKAETLRVFLVKKKVSTSAINLLLASTLSKNGN